MHHERPENKVYEARVDGLLRLKSGSKEARALIEVKPHLRTKDETHWQNIRMQEANQLAAWISETPRFSTENHVLKGKRFVSLHSRSSCVYICEC